MVNAVPPPKKKKTQISSKSKSVEIISPDVWRKYIITNWISLKKRAEQAEVTPYQELVIIALTPVVPRNSTTLKSLQKLIGKLRYTQSLVERIKSIYKDKNYSRTATDLAKSYLNPQMLKHDELEGLDWLLMTTGTLSGVMKNSRDGRVFATQLLDGMKSGEQYPSAVRVQAGMISAGQNVIFAGQDVNVVSHHYHGDKSKLKSYLSSLRTDWNLPVTNIHPASQHHVPAILHQLYTPIDIWKNTEKFKKAGGVQQLNERRFRAIEKDLNDEREPLLEAIATHPLIVITGGAGTGKSSLCRFIVTALAFACDPTAEKREKIKGLDLLGPAWIHGPMLPLYVSLRDFCNDREIFPKTLSKTTAQSLLAYLKTTAEGFAPHLEAYLTQTDVNTHGTLLVLDGLDEVYSQQDRILLRRVIEKWADRFPNCRIVITSRTYAYHKDAQWHLSERFISAELAPFTWQQMETYIERWYAHAARTRPGAFGGRANAQTQATARAENLIKTIRNSKPLVPLARHPLMLALLTLIHEDYKHLPRKRAELYGQTVELLDRWNIPLPTDELHEKLENIDLERMRAALKMIAFDLQSQQKHYQRYPMTIARAQLLDKLKNQQEVGGGLGANIEDVLEYLATRNGILVTDTPKLYRFPHLSIQEYLAACALIEFHDECPMPKKLKSFSPDGWTFPENIGALLRYEYSRWRNVALFAGSILATGAGQVMRWQLIDELLPTKIEQKLPDNIVYSICVSAEIWEEGYLKARTRAQHGIEEHFIKCLDAIINDDRVDLPDAATNRRVLNTLKGQHKK